MSGDVNWDRVARAAFEADIERPALFWEDTTPLMKERYRTMALAVNRALAREPILQTMGKEEPHQ